MNLFKHAQTHSDNHRSMSFRLIVSMSAVSIILAASALISVFEYGKVTNFLARVRESVDIHNSFNRASESLSEYEISIMELMGEEYSDSYPVFDYPHFRSICDSCAREIAFMGKILKLEEMYADIDAYLKEASEAENIMRADFVDNSVWFYETLQPLYIKANRSFGAVVSDAHAFMVADAADFEDGFYASIIPGVVGTLVALILLILLTFFIMRSYVIPICRMLDSLNAYRSNDKKYSYRLQDGDDQLGELNDGISEIVEENRQLRSRIRMIKHSAQSKALAGE